MWDSPEARQDITRTIDLLEQTIHRFRLVRSKGTAADRAQMTGLGIEVMVSLTEAFEIDRDFRNKIRVSAERWAGFTSGSSDLNQFFGSALMSLERLLLIVRAL
jgi:hypothetical protein